MKHLTTGEMFKRTEEWRELEKQKSSQLDGRKEGRRRRMGKYHDGYMRVIPKLGAHPGKDGTLRWSSLPTGPPCAQTRAAVSGNSASSFPGEELRAGMKRQRHHVPEERMSNKHRRRRGLSSPMTRGVDQPQEAWRAAVAGF